MFAQCILQQFLTDINKLVLFTFHPETAVHLFVKKNTCVFVLYPPRVVFSAPLLLKEDNSGTKKL